VIDRTRKSFEENYGRFKNYSTPDLKPKHIAALDKDVWSVSGCAPHMAMLEIGCGTGRFLAYLRHKKVADFVGLDQDLSLAGVIPAGLANNFQNVEVREFLASGARGRLFDRIFLLDVLEHFSVEAGADLLRDLIPALKPDGRIVLKLPNMSSPWGAQYQFGDLTHRAAYTPLSIRQLAQATGYECLTCRAQHMGSPFRRRANWLLNKILDKILMEPPEIWTANFLAVLQPLPVVRKT
jgi:cyclopropane fatty-acyl-phospholipid synthase-like methyltransferase